jgi:cytochrome c553
MKLLESKIFVPLAVAFLWTSPLGANEDLPVRNCTWCHGSSAQGYSTAPRLAGQTRQYIEASLLGFKTHIRDNPYSKQYMWGAAANLTPRLTQDFATYFSGLAPEAANDGNAALAASGKLLFEEGNPESNVVSCIVCHGPEGQGFEGIPRLGGLGYDYLKRRLEQWNEGFHAAAEPMPRIANTLSSDEIEALASYLSFVK